MNIVRITLTIVLAATPLALMHGIFLSHDVIPKVIIILSGAALLLLLLPHWAGGLGILWRQEQGRAFLSLVVAQFFSLLFSTVLSTQQALSLAGTTWRRFGSSEQLAILVIATAAACATAKKPAWTVPLFRAITVSGGVAAFYGVFQYFGIDPFLEREAYAVDYLGGVARPPATMGHAIYFAAWLAPVALIAAFSALSEPDKRWKRIHSGIAVLTCLAILLSGTRGSVLAVIAGAVLLGLQKPFARRSRFGTKIAASAALIIAIAVVFALSPAGVNLRQRLIQWQQDPGGARLGVWLESPALIWQHPLAGAGPETFAVEFRRIESAALSRAYPDFFQETPHNAFLDAACSQGIPGLLILSAVFVLGCWRDKQSPPVRSALQAAVFAILIGSIFVSFSLVAGLYLWSFAGMNAALACREGEPGASAEPGFWLVPATLLGGVFLALAIVLAVPDAVYVNFREAVDAKDAARANDMLTTVNSWSFGLPGQELWCSREMATLGVSLGNSPGGTRAWGRATEFASSAETLSEERFSAVYQSSVLAVAAGDLRRAEGKAREAIVMAPNWYKPHLLLAQILQATNRGEEAAKQARASIDLGWQPK